MCIRDRKENSSSNFSSSISCDDGLYTMICPKSSTALNTKNALAIDRIVTHHPIRVIKRLQPFLQFSSLRIPGSRKRKRLRRPKPAPRLPQVRCAGMPSLVSARRSNFPNFRVGILPHTRVSFICSACIFFKRLCLSLIHISNLFRCYMPVHAGRYLFQTPCHGLV